MIFSNFVRMDHHLVMTAIVVKTLMIVDVEVEIKGEIIRSVEMILREVMILMVLETIVRRTKISELLVRTFG